MGRVVRAGVVASLVIVGAAAAGVAAAAPALDAQTREVMHDLILHILALEERTIVFVTHDVEEAVYLADRVIVLAPVPGHIDSVWRIGLPPALERTQDLK